MATARARNGKLVDVDDRFWADHTRYTWSGQENSDRDRCHEQGGIFVRDYFRVDGTFVRAFCKKRGNSLEIPERYAYRKR